MSEDKTTFHNPTINHSAQVAEVQCAHVPDDKTKLAVKGINQAFVGAKMTYKELVALMQQEPFATTIKLAPKTPHPLHKESTQKEYNSWEWFQDYVGNYVLYAHTGFPDLMLANMAPQISERIKARKQEFDAIEKLLSKAERVCVSEDCEQTVAQGKTKLRAFRTQVAVLEKTLDDVAESASVSEPLDG